MATRRLVLMFAALLALAVLASAVAPREPVVRDGRPEVAPPAGVTAGVVRGRLPAERTVSAVVGDVVELEVTVESPDQVEISDLGLKAAADPRLPAQLTFVADRAGRFPVRLRFADRQVGAVEVKEPS